VNLGAEPRLQDHHILNFEDSAGRTCDQVVYLIKETYCPPIAAFRHEPVRIVSA
jgi:hypothetical protein